MSKVDQITVEVIHNYLLSAAREMNRNLTRTSYNTIVYEVHDFGLGIYDRKGRLLAEAPGLAVFTRGNDYGLQKLIEYLGEDNIHPGDLILLNYPYWSSAHILDVMATSPIFHGDKLMGFTAVKIHWLDLGQKDPGYVLDSVSVFQEGLIMPCLKIYNRGVLNKELEELIRFNSRMPDRVLGDMNAQISSCRTGERRVQELIEKFGPDTYEQAIEEILDHGDRITRARLAELPKGTWSAEDFVDDDGINKDILVKLKATVTITDDEMVIDWTGSDPATEGPINLPFGLTTGISALAFKSVTTPDTPATEGNFRALRVEAPSGSVMHAVPPQPTFTLWTGLLAIEVVTKALAKGLPNAVPACSGGDIFSVMGVGVHPDSGKIWLEATNEGVGFGAHAGGDGENGMMHLSEPGCRNNPIEILETKAPWLIEKYQLRQDSGGAGEHRGGVGLTRTYKFMADASALTLVKKTKTKPWGMAGGKDGGNGHVILRPGTDREDVTGMVYESMAPGDVLVNNSGGGGGWGNPFNRDPQKVLEDVRNEYVSLKAARQEYGVVIDPETLTIDMAATAAARQVE
ncbi:MAG: hydantoinase B/oxoprolinase family protein [Chloroflexota bacterium]